MSKNEHFRHCDTVCPIMLPLQASLCFQASEAVTDVGFPGIVY